MPLRCVHVLVSPSSINNSINTVSQCTADDKGKLLSSVKCDLPATEPLSSNARKVEINYLGGLVLLMGLFWI